MCILILKYGRRYFDRDFLHISIRKFIHLFDEWVFVFPSGRVDFQNTEVSVYKKRVIVLLRTIF